MWREKKEKNYKNSRTASVSPYVCNVYKVVIIIFNNKNEIKKKIVRKENEKINTEKRE